MSRVPSITIPGYNGGPYSDHRDWLVRHLFWISYLTAFFRYPGLDELPLGPDYEASIEFNAQIRSRSDWPLFTVPLDSDALVYVVYRNLEGDKAIDLLRHRAGDLRVEYIASTNYGPAFPDLTWPGLLAASRVAVRDGSTDDADERLLLLLPALGYRNEFPDGAAAALTSALSACTAVDDPAGVAALLLTAKSS